jgi:hypothetical protein
MAFSASEFLPLSGMANSNAPRHWTYKSTDSKATMVASGYFDARQSELNVNDIIWAIGATGGTETLTTIVVDAISGAGVVTVLSTVQTLA